MGKGRPGKVGLDWFSFDVDFFEDEKIQFVSARFGIKGEIVAVKLLCKIYRNGFYIKFGEDEKLLFAKRAGDIPLALVNDIVDELVKRDFFDKIIFNSFEVLTSNGIQKRFFSATGRRNSEINEQDSKFLIQKGRSFLAGNGQKTINADNKSIIVDNNSINACNNATKESKVKESKEEKKKIKKKSFSPPIRNEVIQFFLDNGFSEESAIKAFNYYQEGSWIDSRGAPVQNWKQKMRGVWFKDENKKLNGKDKHNNFKEKVYASTPDEEISWLRD